MHRVNRAGQDLNPLWVYFPFVQALGPQSWNQCRLCSLSLAVSWHVGLGILWAVHNLLWVLISQLKCSVHHTCHDEVCSIYGLGLSGNCFSTDIRGISYSLRLACHETRLEANLLTSKYWWVLISPSCDQQAATTSVKSLWKSSLQTMTQLNKIVGSETLIHSW